MYNLLSLASFSSNHALEIHQVLSISCSFLFRAVVFHCKYGPHFVDSFTCWWSFGLFSENTKRLFRSLFWEYTICFYSLTLLIQNTAAAAAAAKSFQSCPTLCYPIDGSPPGSPVPGILQARTLEWVAISFSNAWKWKVKGKSLSRVRLFVTPWTAAYQAPLSMGFSRQEYWSGVPSPSPLVLS